MNEQIKDTEQSYSDAVKAFKDQLIRMNGFRIGSTRLTSLTGGMLHRIGKGEWHFMEDDVGEFRSIANSYPAQQKPVKKVFRSEYLSEVEILEDCWLKVKQNTSLCVKQSEVVSDEDFLTTVISLRKVKAFSDRYLNEAYLSTEETVKAVDLVKSLSKVLRYMETTIDGVTTSKKRNS